MELAYGDQGFFEHEPPDGLRIRIVRYAAICELVEAQAQEAEAVEAK
jgi:hypothetical protein